MDRPGQACFDMYSDVFMIVSVLSDDFSEDNISKRLEALAEENMGGLTALEASSILKVSLTLAQEFLKVRKRQEKNAVYSDTLSVILYIYH